ncbi:helix-turn-helix domain-containing protein [Novosphingobium malaysiense]|uniref:HTH araC/xylS-type domain-containing protein n=1 Tax=Novosphingobium malaysiense TaxID=1348853 RepID=A0A0B1ZM32_9SPHN|nr:AraC family transcriptional regulator [Novosphingobium malaysiense]KHK90253.1 hypothetical protein LK12_16535 [Novosphingobium malaysiense]
MWAHSYDLLGASEIEGMRTEVRRFHKVSPYCDTVAVPANILSCRFRRRPAARAGDARAVTGFPLSESFHFLPRSFQREFESDGEGVEAVIMFLEDKRIDFSLASGSQEFFWDPSLVEIAGMICREAISPGFASMALLESCKEILVIKLLRDVLKEKAAQSASGGIGKADLDQIKDYVLSCRGGGPNVSRMAEICRMSRRTLLRRFHAATGKSPSQFAAELQFAKSRELLVASSMSVKEIAFETGFASPSQFSRAFKRMAGLSPAAFQKQVRE